MAIAGYAVDIVRGLWNLFATRGSQKITLSGVRYEGLGVIYTGVVQTLHNVDGSNVADTFWYDPDIPPIHKLFPESPVEKTWLHVERWRCWAQRQLASVPYAKEYRSVIAVYARALDHTNLDLACLQLWAILETITGTVGKSYDATISRTLWDYSDRDTSKHLLDFLRLRRNQYVHASVSVGDRQYAAYLLKDFVDHHLIRLLRNDYKVKSFHEYGDFLDLPSSLDNLKSRRDRLKLAVRLKQEAQKARADREQERDGEQKPDP